MLMPFFDLRWSHSLSISPSLSSIAPTCYTHHLHPPFFFFETGFLCVALAVLELTLYTRLASNSEIRLTLPPEC